MNSNNVFFKKIRFKSYLILLASLFLFVFQINAASIKNLSIENGLSNRRVLASACDGKGYIWFATKTNIDRYDGENFDSYKLSNFEKIRGIVSDNKNNIYAFTDQTAYYYDENIDDFKQIYSMRERNDFFTSASINGLYFNRENKLVLATNFGALLYDNKKVSVIAPLNHISVFCVVFNPKGDYLFGTQNGLIELKMNSKNDFTLVKDNSFEAFKNFRVQSLYYDIQNNKLWVGTFASGLYVYETTTKKVEEIQKITLPVKVITNISNNEIWAGTDGDGIFIYNSKTAQFKRKITHSDTQEESIGANGVYHILQAAGSVWISTYTGGIFVVNTQSIVEKQFKHQKNNSNSISDDHVNVIFEDNEGDLWFGTNKGVSLYLVKTNSWKFFLLNGNGISNENSVILAIMQDKSNNIWIGGYGTKLAKINKKTGSVEYIDNASDEKEAGSFLI